MQRRAPKIALFAAAIASAAAVSPAIASRGDSPNRADLSPMPLVQMEKTLTRLVNQHYKKIYFFPTKPSVVTQMTCHLSKTQTQASCEAFWRNISLHATGVAYIAVRNITSSGFDWRITGGKTLTG